MEGFIIFNYKKGQDFVQLISAEKNDVIAYSPVQQIAEKDGYYILLEVNGGTTIEFANNSLIESVRIFNDFVKAVNSNN